ncbi:MAG: c-type cytochrome [Chloroflexota bacterium]|nr:c-type cytochrome [Chloroflexota bacterium]
MPGRHAARRRAIASGIGILCTLLVIALSSSVCSDGDVEGGPLGLTPDDTANLFSGGETTATNVTRNAFSFSARNLDREQRRRFELGDSFFEQNWVTAPSSTEARDGLGPTFNAQSCSSCHALDGRGRPPFSNDDPERGLLLRLSLPEEFRELFAPDTLAAPKGGPVPDPVYGNQLQDRAIQKVQPEGRMVITYVEVHGTYADGSTFTLLKPTYSVGEPAYGPPHEALQISPRVAPSVFGSGLLEAIPVEILELLADPDDEDGDGISGRIHMIWNPDSGQFDVGRFGWKATAPSVRLQSANAFLGDIGITSSIHDQQNCPEAQTACRSAIPGGDPEVSDERFEAVVFYSQTLAVPAARGYSTRKRGAELFFAAGCHLCHVPKLTTGEHEIDALSDQVILPYTDLLLHDMGPELSDNRPVHDAAGSEWRTPPLWGIGLIEAVNGHNRLMHDGRARGVAEAILWHGGEAEASREAFRNMSAEDRQALIDFINSL